MAQLKKEFRALATRRLRIKIWLNHVRSVLGIDPADDKKTTNVMQQALLRFIKGKKDLEGYLLNEFRCEVIIYQGHPRQKGPGSRMDAKLLVPQTWAKWRDNGSKPDEKYIKLFDKISPGSSNVLSSRIISQSLDREFWATKHHEPENWRNPAHPMSTFLNCIDFWAAEKMDEEAVRSMLLKIVSLWRPEFQSDGGDIPTWRSIPLAFYIYREYRKSYNALEPTSAAAYLINLAGLYELKDCFLEWTFDLVSIALLSRALIFHNGDPYAGEFSGTSGDVVGLIMWVFFTEIEEHNGLTVEDAISSRIACCNSDAAAIAAGAADPNGEPSGGSIDVVPSKRRVVEMLSNARKRFIDEIRATGLVPGDFLKLNKHRQVDAHYRSGRATQGEWQLGAPF